MAGQQPVRLPLTSLNHLSFTVADVVTSCKFYVNVLGFIEVKRPHALQESFEGAWLHNYNLGIHLIHGKPICRPAEIRIQDDHFSFQSDNIADVEERLLANRITYKKNMFIEDGCRVTQLFFHDPEHHMIEVCNCDVLPVTPLLPECAICPKMLQPQHSLLQPQLSAGLLLPLCCGDLAAARDQQQQLQMQPCVACMAVAGPAAGAAAAAAGAGESEALVTACSSQQPHGDCFDCFAISGVAAPHSHAPCHAGGRKCNACCEAFPAAACSTASGDCASSTSSGSVSSNGMDGSSSTSSCESVGWASSSSTIGCDSSNDRSSNGIMSDLATPQAPRDSAQDVASVSADACAGSISCSASCFAEAAVCPLPGRQQHLSLASCCHSLGGPVSTLQQPTMVSCMHGMQPNAVISHTMYASSRTSRGHTTDGYTTLASTRQHHPSNTMSALHRTHGYNFHATCTAPGMLQATSMPCPGTDPWVSPTTMIMTAAAATAVGMTAFGAQHVGHRFSAGPYSAGSYRKGSLGPFPTAFYTPPPYACVAGAEAAAAGVCSAGTAGKRPLFAKVPSGSGYGCGTHDSEQWARLLVQRQLGHGRGAEAMGAPVNAEHAGYAEHACAGLDFQQQQQTEDAEAEEAVLAAKALDHALQAAAAAAAAASCHSALRRSTSCMALLHGAGRTACT